MGWLILVGMFLITAFVTFGIFANVADAKRERVAAPSIGVASAAGAGRLSAKLTEELKAIEARGDSAQDWLNKARVPYGYCLSREGCDGKTRCVQCDSFETGAEDLPALRKLLQQEVGLSELAERRGLEREAEIHRRIAGSVREHVDRFEAAHGAA